MNSLSFGPLSKRSLMVCIDMQRLFLEPGEWFAEPALSILPNCEQLARAGAQRCLFTRFITAFDERHAKGSWRRYYRHWHSVTRKVIGDDAMAIHPVLRNYAHSERCFDKSTYDAFGSPAFADHIQASRPDALVLFGIETDVCVLATALSAIDLGYRIVIVRDAVASSLLDSHTACLTHIYTRFDQQIEIVDTPCLVNAWNSL